MTATVSWACNLAKLIARPAVVNSRANIGLTEGKPFRPGHQRDCDKPRRSVFVTIRRCVDPGGKAVQNRCALRPGNMHGWRAEPVQLATRASSHACISGGRDLRDGRGWKASSIRPAAFKTGFLHNSDQQLGAYVHRVHANFSCQAEALGGCFRSHNPRASGLVAETTNRHLFPSKGQSSVVPDSGSPCQKNSNVEKAHLCTWDQCVRP
jgi:hypothetical protein